MTEAASRNERYAVLDGMRAAAALVVITDHVPSDLLMGLLPGRYLAVDFFFALSGFVLVHVYGPRLAHGWTFWRFMGARVKRLYPLYLLATALGAALAFAYTWKGWISATFLQDGASALFGALYLPAPPALSVHADEPFPFNGPAWSLFFELLINVIFALIATRLRWLGLTAILLVNAALLAWTAFTFGKLDSGFLWSNFLGGFPRVGYAFFAGVAVYRLRALWRTPAPPAWLCFGALMAVFMIPAPAAWRPAYDVLAATILFPALLMFAANAQTRGAALKLCLAGGALSYGFYVLQVPVRDWVGLMLSLHAHGAAPAGVAMVALVAGLTVAAAALLHVVYDKPVRRLLTRKSAPSPIAADATPS